MPTCALDEMLADVAERVRRSGWDTCVVVDTDRCVVGLLRAAQLSAGDEGERVEQVMRPGPSTFRPHVPAAQMAAFMEEHELPTAPITTSDGHLIGLLRREDAAAAAHAEHQGDGHG